MDRLFLDANILFSAAYRRDTGLLKLWRLENAELRSSRYAVEGAKVNLTEQVQRRRLARLVAAIRLFEAGPSQLPTDVSLPEKDAPILLAAIDARATHLITGDIRHFGPYLGKSIRGVRVLTPAAYLKTKRTL